MKTLIAILAAAASLLLIAGFAYVLLVMEDPEAQPPQESSSSGSSQAEQTAATARLNAPKEIDTDADVLDALDYYTERNQDTVGWLKIKGTDINNSVLQSHNNFTYLRTDEFREYDLYGCYFADWECSIGSRDVFSSNTVIYGHSDLTDKPEGPRFSQLFHFTDQAFAEKTPTIQFSTLESGVMDWEIFAVFYVDKTFAYIDAEPPDGVEALAKEVQAMSLYDYGVTVGPEDKILTLSTCSVKDGPQDRDHRFVVMARLLPDGAEVPKTANIKPQTPAE